MNKLDKMTREQLESVAVWLGLKAESVTVWTDEQLRLLITARAVGRMLVEWGYDMEHGRTRCPESAQPIKLTGNMIVIDIKENYEG